MFSSQQSLHNRSGHIHERERERERECVGATYQELQVAAVAAVAGPSIATTPTVDRHTTTKLTDGALVVDALSHAPFVSFTFRIQRLVCRPIERNDWWHH